jgi:hypothetical protein
MLVDWREVPEDVRGLAPGKLGLDRLAIRRWARHAGHAALRPGLPLRCGETSFTAMR